MASHIRIDRLQAEKPRYIYWNERKQHPLSADLLKTALALAEDGLWSQHQTHGERLGEILYRLLDGSGGLMQRLLEARDRDGDASALCLELPPDMVNLPFEILWDGHAFLSVRGRLPILRQVVDRRKGGTSSLPDRPVRILFMACSPLDVLPILDYEGEEEAIIQQLEGEKLPVECYVEESGSLDGLKFALREYGPFDVVHLTGHASAKDGSRFAMESDVGLHDPITPEALWKAMRNTAPQLLFLSGCETGTHSGEAAASFGQAMVKLGVPMALGWGLSVAEDGATAFAHMFYQGLGEGLSVTQAMQQAHQDLAEGYQAWPQLRLFADQSPMRALTDPSEKVKHRSPRKETYRMLQESQVKVLEYGFVGRRRQSQQGIRVLKGGVPNKNGLLITGAAGVGKSTLCGKLVTRFSEKSFEVFSGVLSESGILNRLEDLFTQKGHAGGMAILKEQTEFKTKIHALFRGPFQEVPTLLVFDNFEDNLEQHGEEFWLKQGVGPMLLPIFEALAWANGKTQVIITSRYPFVLEANGKEWVDACLERLPLMALRGADLRKKRNRLSHLKSSRHQALYEEFSGGNPRLLEWFETLAQTSVDLDEAQLREDLAGQSEAFKQKYLANVIKNAQSPEFQAFLAKASVYRTPVQAAAFKAFGSEDHLQKAAGLTLMEQEGTVDPVYWVMPLLRESYWRDVKDQAAVHREAYAYYQARLQGSKDFHFETEEACLYHGEHGLGMQGCWLHALKLSNFYLIKALFREGSSRLFSLKSYLPNKITKEFVNEEIRFLGNLALLMKRTDQLKEAENLMKQVLVINKAVYGENHPEVAISLNNLGQLFKETNRYAEAERNMRLGMQIDEEHFGNFDPRVANHLANLGDLLLQMNSLAEAEKLIRRALEIDELNYGKSHETVARDLSRLGRLLHASANFDEAEDALRRSLAINKQVFGERHPLVSFSLNNLAMLLLDIHRWEEAETLMRDALDIDESFYGENGSSVARDLNNLALVFQMKGNVFEAEKLFIHALKIDEKLYGRVHDSVANRLNNLACLLMEVNRHHDAEPLIHRARCIDEEIHGFWHPFVARDLNNIGMLQHRLNRLEEAESTLSQALEINEFCYGKNHPRIVGSLRNLAELFLDKNQFEKSQALMYRALTILELSFGANDPVTQECLNNLGVLFHKSNRFNDAEKVFRRVIGIAQKTYGSDHPAVAIDLNNLARLLQDTNRLEEAEPLMRRALAIFHDSLGADHPNTQVVKRNYEALCAQMKQS